MKFAVTNRHTLSVLAVASALALTACGKTEEPPTAGERLDAAIATVEQKTEAVGREVKQGLDAARTGTADAVDAVKAGTADAMDAVKAETADARITTLVSAELARDPELSALKIDVETQAGKVLLKGSAPSGAARDRAVTLARAVSGVVGVDNQLRIGG